MDLGFGGEVTEFYHRYRRGYPSAAIEAVVQAFELNEDDVVIDLGCGTGQLALPIARRVSAVVGVDPEPDMLLRARQAAADEDVSNASWMIGTDADIPALHALLSCRSVGAVTIAQALHWMNPNQLFPALAMLVRAGGGVAIVTNGRPLWLQQNAWSEALRGVLEDWLGTTLTQSCGTDEHAQARYWQSLAHAGFAVSEVLIDYSDTLTTDQIVGGVYSALPVGRLPDPDQRLHFAEQIHDALEHHAPFIEHVSVAILIGKSTGCPP